MANRLMDVALRATIGRGLELDLHISLVLGSMHLELYAGPDRYAIIPCAFEVSLSYKSLVAHCRSPAKRDMTVSKNLFYCSVHNLII